MKAIVLAAGEGTRLRPYTETKPKCLVEYKGRPILDYICESLKKGGVTDIVIVGGYRAEQLEAYGTRRYVNSEFNTTNMVETLFTAVRELEGDVIISYSDIVYDASIVKRLCASTDPITVVIDKAWRTLWEQRMENPLLDAESLRMTPDGYIREIGKPPVSYADIEGQYMGLLKVSTSAIEKFVEFYRSLDREALYDGKTFRQMYMTTFLQRMIDSGVQIRALEIKGGWIEIDSPSDLEIDVLEALH